MCIHQHLTQNIMKKTRFCKVTPIVLFRLFFQPITIEYNLPFVYRKITPTSIRCWMAMPAYTFNRFRNSSTKEVANWSNDHGDCRQISSPSIFEKSFQAKEVVVGSKYRYLMYRYLLLPARSGEILFILRVWLHSRQGRPILWLFYSVKATVE